MMWVFFFQNFKKYFIHFEFLSLLMRLFPGKDLYSDDVMDYLEAGGAPPPPPPPGLPVDPGRQAAFDLPDEAYSFADVKKRKTSVTTVARVRQDFRESWLWTEATTGYLSTTRPANAIFFIKHGGDGSCLYVMCTLWKKVRNV